MKFKVLLRHPIATRITEPADKHDFHYVADITAKSIEDVYCLTQNGNPNIKNETGTWAKEPYAQLTKEGERLQWDGSLRSLSIGDIVVGPDNKIFMVAGIGWQEMKESGHEYKVRQNDMV